MSDNTCPETKYTYITRMDKVKRPSYTIMGPCLKAGLKLEIVRNGCNKHRYFFIKKLVLHVQVNNFFRYCELVISFLRR